MTEPQTPYGRSTRLTPEGTVLLLLLGGFFLGALNTGTNLLYFLTGLLLNLYALSFLVARWSVGALAVSREGPRSVVQGQSVEVRWVARGERFVAFPVVARELEAPEHLAAGRPAGFVGVEPDRPLKARTTVTFTRRGPVELPGLRLVSRAPFGLLEVSRPQLAPWHVLVLPATRGVRPELLDVSGRAAESLARRWAGITEERRDVMRSLRDHRPGDDRRSVHWRSTARRGTLVIKEFERTAPEQGIVLLDLAGADPETEEAAVTLAASLFAAEVRAGRRVGLGLVGAGAPEVLAPLACEASLLRGLRALARLESDARPDLPRLLRGCSRLLQSARVFFVTTRSRPRGVPPQARVFSLGSPADAERCYTERGR